MTTENPYHNNPLHGLKLETLLNELVEQYGFELLDAYLNINCFRKKPTIASSIKFLKKTDWAREKVEAFYLYQYKGLPKADDVQFQLKPRERIVPTNQQTKPPADLSFEDAERLRAKKAIKTRERAKSSSKDDPWSNVK